MIHLKSFLLCSGKCRFTYLLLNAQLCKSALCFRLNEKRTFNNWVVHCLEWLMWKRLCLPIFNLSLQFADCNKILCIFLVMPNEKYLGKIHFFALNLLCTWILLNYKNRKKLNSLFLYMLTFCIFFYENFVNS